jgi:hypothetical protein
VSSPEEALDTGRRVIDPKALLKQVHLGDPTQLKTSGRGRDLAMFNGIIDAKLRACDLVRLTISGVAPVGGLRTPPR